MKRFFLNLFAVFFTLFMLLVPLIHAEAVDVSEITAPLSRIYDLVKAVVSIVAVLALTFAGARFMFSGDNIQAREATKNMMAYAVIGLVVVWIAPLLVGYLTAPVA